MIELQSSKPQVRPRAVLIRALRLWLPLTAATAVVMLPLVGLYENSLRQTVEARVGSLVDASVLRTDALFAEIRANSGVIARLPALNDALEPGEAGVLGRKRLEAVFGVQVEEYHRYSSLRAYRPDGVLVVGVNRHGPMPARATALGQAQDGTSKAVLSQAIRAANGLQHGNIWLSRVFWPEQPTELGLERRAPVLAVARPLFSAQGQRQGALVFITNLGPLFEEFDRLSNPPSKLVKGYLLDGNGLILNPTMAAAVLNFRSRFPQDWNRIRGSIDNPATRSDGARLRPNLLLSGDIGQSDLGAGSGMFLYRSIALLPAPVAAVPANPQSPAQAAPSHWFSVIQIPPESLQRTSIFQNPVGQALTALVVLLLAAGSGITALYAERFELAHRAERQTFERLRTLMQQSRGGTCVFDPRSGRVVAFNQAFCAFYELAPEALDQLSWNDFEGFRELADQEQLLGWLQGGQQGQSHSQVQRLRTDRRRIWGDISVSTSRDADGQIIDVIAQVNDVTDLLNKTLYLEAASSAGLVGIWDWDVATNVLNWDRGMYTLYGISPDVSIETFDAWSGALHPDDAEAVQAALQAAIQSGTEFRSRFRILWPDGSVHHLQAISSMEADRDGHPIRMIGVNYDVTELLQREEELQQQRDLFEGTIQALVDPHLVLTVASADNVVQFVVSDANPAAARFFRRSQALLEGLPLNHLLHPKFAESFLQQLSTVQTHGQPLISDDNPVFSAVENPELSVDLRAVRIGDQISLSFRDITSSKQAQQQLQGSEERFRLLAENVTDVVCILQNGRLSWVAPGLSRLLGWIPSHWQGRRLEDLCHADDQELAHAIQLEVETGHRRDYRLRIADDQNDWHWAEIHAGPYRRADGQQVGSVLSLRLVDKEIAVEEELERRARVDALTGLLNRKEILDRIEALARRQRHSDRQIAMLFCDVDFFKQINDKHGHAGGDTVLKALAERLRTLVRAGDLVGRIGGDELLVVLDGFENLDQALQFAQRLQQQVCQPISLSSGEVTPTLSIGVTVVGAEEAMDAVIARADLAMYQSKQSGRNRVSAIPAGNVTAIPG
ncbi:diguanylate cyclase [Synechococcus sp. BA-132 BA5]|uniref:diguanylate cyclase n=1 Tax=Synechococcus sp. BA-132 BA5 TaxID=3110252 RepID=UPI002B1F4C00|nr:diguanylate cyclase [Synechococcus sp. BA-132 BA5]MEA5414370.1 diguanylate cyclase [Synechococcus sp. BA-132 BA5]